MSDDKVHYLRPVPPPTDVATLRQRLDGLESEMLTALRELETKLEVRSESARQLSPELGEALGQLEQRIRSELEHLRRGDLADDINGLLSKVEQRFTNEDYGKRLQKLRLSYRAVEVDDYGFDPVFAERLQPIFDFLFHKYFRVEVRGIEHIPREGRGLLVANHSGTLPYDGLMLSQAVRNLHPRRRVVRALAEDFVFHFPYLGVLINRLGHVRACQENADRMLREDRLVAVFPEGIKGIGKLYDKRYQLQRFGRGGFIKLAMRTETPIIPVAIVGAEEIHPMIARLTWLVRDLGVPYLPITPTFPWLGALGAIPLPSKWTIVFGPPIDVAQHGRAGLSDRLLINRLTEEVRQSIQTMVLDVLKQRRSIWFG